MNILIRTTEPEDIEWILELEKESFSFPHAREQLEREVCDPNYLLLTADCEEPLR